METGAGGDSNGLDKPGGGGAGPMHSATSTSDHTTDSELPDEQLQQRNGALSQSGGSAWMQPPPGYVPTYTIEDYVHPSTKSSHDLRATFHWNSMLSEPGFCAAPVTGFKHAPMSDRWDCMVLGMKAEVALQESDHHSSPSIADGDSFWVASVLRISGYYALFRYEGFGQDASKDFWLHLCSDQMHHIGWCSTKSKSLVPPKAIADRYEDWKDFLVKRLSGARTAPQRYYEKIWESVASVFRKGMTLEVVDKSHISQVRTATILDVTGRRLYLKYDGVDDLFWCHEESPLIHPVGWAKRVGHKIAANREYFERCTREQYLDTDCTPDMFPSYPTPPANFVAGMKIEAVDPLNLVTICVATVMKVLRFGYLMLRCDGYQTDEAGSDWFCYHASSPLIFPPGFCERNDIKLNPPQGYQGDFTWAQYLKETNSQAAPIGLFCAKEDVKHGFKVGMKVEAADEMDPRLICVSTITRVVGRLLRVHFDGWDDSFDQWMDCESVDIYPVGWAALVGHKLEKPGQVQPVKKEKRKPTRKGGKKRASLAGSNNGSSNSNGSTTPTPLSKRFKKSPVGSQSTPPPRQQPSAPAVEDEEAINTGDDGVTPTGTPTPSRTPPPPVLEPQTTPTHQGNSSLSGGTNASSLIPASSSGNQSSNDPVTPTGMTSPAKHIPRLVDSPASHGHTPRSSKESSLDASSWSVQDISTFLNMNDCANLVEPFNQAGIDGMAFLSLSKDDILKLVNNKIGPCLKVENLLSLLKARISRTSSASGRK